jgi:hypothetical protein
MVTLIISKKLICYQSSDSGSTIGEVALKGCLCEFPKKTHDGYIDDLGQTLHYKAKKGLDML